MPDEGMGPPTDVKTVKVGVVDPGVENAVSAGMETLAGAGVVGVSRVLMSTAGTTGASMSACAAWTTGAPMVPAAVSNAAAPPGFGPGDEHELRPDECQACDGRRHRLRELMHRHRSFYSPAVANVIFKEPSGGTNSKTASFRPGPRSHLENSAVYCG